MAKARKRLAAALARRLWPPNIPRRVRDLKLEGSAGICKVLVGDRIGRNTEGVQGAKLLMQLCRLLEQSRIRSIDDPRVAPEVRRVWECLIDSEALHAVSDTDMERVWRIIRVSRRMVVCGTAAPFGSGAIDTVDRKRERQPTTKGGSRRDARLEVPRNKAAIRRTSRSVTNSVS